MRRFLVLAMLAVGAVAGLTVGASVASATMLTVTLSGAGKGLVTSDPAGIECSNVPGAVKTECAADFAFFAVVKLKAVGATGAVLRGWSGNAGGTCMVAINPTANPCSTGSVLFTPMDVEATFAPKPDPPVVTTGSASNVEFPSARVAGTVNPVSEDFSIEDCHFEYGLTTEYGLTSACRPGAAEIGTGTSPVAVSASIGVLEPRRTYHYRLVAANAGGPGPSEDRTFISAAAPVDDCPNAAIRAQQGALAQRLPNCGAYELVSPPFTAGQGAGMAVGTADGDRVMLQSVGGFAGTENLPDLGVQYVTSRTEAGWTSSAIAPPASQFPFIGTYAALDWTRDGSRSLWFVNLKEDEGTKRFTPIVRDPDGSFHVAGPTQDDEMNLPVATSGDLSTVVQQTSTRPALTDGTDDGRGPGKQSLYASTRGPDGRLKVRQVAYRAGATMFPNCDAKVGGTRPLFGFTTEVTARNAVSADGSKIFFSTGCPAADAQRVWVKVGDADPVDLSESQCPATCGPEEPASFRGASRDGSRVYFTTEQQLLPEDQDTSDRSDLYEYDFNATGQKLRLVTGGTGPVGAGVGSSSTSLFRVSDDGAYVYFTATGRALAEQNARGVAPQPGDNNLYVYHRAAGQANGTTTFVGVRAPSDIEIYPQTSSTGRFLLFASAADPTGERLSGDEFPDLYRYDAQDDELLRVWSTDPTHNGAARVGGPNVRTVPEGPGGVPAGGMQRISGGWYNGLQVSDDGSMVGFTTAEPLSPDDHNTRADAYLWQAGTGRIVMLTDGTSAPGNVFSGSQFGGMTPSGGSLFVTSASPLLKEHTSGQNAVYAVRRGGGFAEPAAPAPPCEGEACQGPDALAPGPLPAAGSSVFSGPGNHPLPAANTMASVRVAKPKAVRGSATRLAARVSGKGKLVVSGAGLTRTSLSVGESGTYRVPVKLSQQGTRALQRGSRLKVRASVRFVPVKGKAAVARVSVTFVPKVKKSRARKRASARSAGVGVVVSNVQKGR